MQNMAVSMNILFSQLTFLDSLKKPERKQLKFLKVTFLLPYLLHKQNKNFSEDLDKVDEKVEGMGDKVLVSHPGLPNDQLGVEHDEAAEDSQAKPDVSLNRSFKTVVLP